MTSTAPVPIPTALLTKHLADPDQHDLTDWQLTFRNAAAAASGELYAVHDVRRRSAAADETDPTAAGFAYTLVTRYAPDGTPLATAATEGQKDWWCVTLPDGTPVLTGVRDGSRMLRPDLSATIADAPLAGFRATACTGTTPSGRLLCVSTESVQVGNWPGLTTTALNILSLSDKPLTTADTPSLRALAVLHPTPRPEQSHEHSLQFDGAPLDADNRPVPPLTEQIEESLLPHHVKARCWLYRPRAVREDLFVVPVYGRVKRSGIGNHFAHLLIDDRGAVVGRLDGMDKYRDSPYTGSHWQVVPDPAREWIYHLNRHGLYVWSASGDLLVRLDPADPDYKQLAAFSLHDCTPDGELILLHDKQRLLLRLPRPDTPDDLGRTAQEALRTYAKERRTLTREQPEGKKGVWTTDTAPLHWL